MKRPIRFENPNKLPWVLVEKVSAAIAELEEFGHQFEQDNESEFLDLHLQDLIDRKKNHFDVWLTLPADREGSRVPGSKITQELVNMHFSQLMLYALSLYVEALYCESIEDFVTYFGQGNQIAGYAMGIAWKEDEPLVRSNLAKKAAKASKVDTELQKVNILQWYWANKHLFRSVDQASIQAARVEPIQPRTAAKWIRMSIKEKAESK